PWPPRSPGRTPRTRACHRTAPWHPSARSAPGWWRTPPSSSAHPRPPQWPPRSRSRSRSRAGTTASSPTTGPPGRPPTGSAADRCPPPPPAPAVRRRPATRPRPSGSAPCPRCRSGPHPLTAPGHRCRSGWVPTCSSARSVVADQTHDPSPPVGRSAGSTQAARPCAGSVPRCAPARCRCAAWVRSSVLVLAFRRCCGRRYAIKGAADTLTARCGLFCGSLLVRGLHLGLGDRLQVSGDRDDPVALVWFGERHTLGGAAGEIHLAHRGPHDLALLHDHQHLVVSVGDQRPDQVSTCLDQVRHLDAETATALHAVLRDPGAL